MKLRNLLPCLLLGASLTASAKFPIYFRDSGNIVDGKIVPENGGHFNFPLTEDGQPAFDEDGAITATTNEYGVNGIWLRTKKLTEAIPEGHTIFAFDYKSNRDVNNIVLFPQEGFNNAANQIHGSVLTVSDNYQSFYMIVDWNLTPGWGSEEKYAGNYFWISSNDDNAKREGWEITIKNLRLLTLAEATEECKNAPATAGDISDNFMLPNADFARDFDPDMDGGCDIFLKNGGNPVFQSGNLLKPLPNGYTTFCFDYKLTGASYQPKVYLHKNPLYTEMTAVPMPDGLVLEGTPEDEVYDAPWKTFSIDLSKQIEEIGFASVFGSNHFLWVQNMAIQEDQMLWVKNIRWTNPNATGIEEITYNPERPADDRIFNLMGIECKGDLAPGIYIQNGKKFIVK